MSAPTIAKASSRFLELRALSALDHLRFTTRHRIEGAFSGRHRSRSQSGSGEFVDYRDYSPGEDLRRFDWKVFARSGRTYLRLYQDETNLVCTLAIDASASMSFGDNSERFRQSKLDYVRFLATAFSHVISRQQDQVGLALIADGLTEQVPPGSTPGHVARIQTLIESAETTPVTRLGQGLADLFARLRQRGVLILLSDFLVDDLEEVFASIRLFRHRRYEVILLHVIHPDEERLPDGTAFRFQGMENDGYIECSPNDIRARYEESFEAHTAMVRSLALASGCDYRRVSTGVPYLRTLGGFLVERRG